MLEKGYRKIPENTVVLTVTETEERLIDLLVDFDEMGFYPATTCPNPDEYARQWKSKLIYAIGQLRKETAEKFVDWLKTECYDGGVDEKWVAVTFSRLDEIAKDIAEGKV